MRHMKQAWRTNRIDGDVRIETDVPANGPLWVICDMAHLLPDDPHGEKTAIAIVKAHNDALKAEIVKNHAERWLVSLPEETVFWVVQTAFTMLLDPISGARQYHEFYPGEILAYERATQGRAFLVNGKGERGSIVFPEWSRRKDSFDIKRMEDK